MKKSLTKIIADLRPAHPDIHHGGCAKFSKIVIDELSKKGIKAEAKVIQYYSSNRRLKNVRDIPPENIWKKVVFDHVVIKVGKYYFDNTTISTNKKGMVAHHHGKMYPGSLTKEQLDYVTKHGR